MSLGNFTKGFLASPGKLGALPFLGISFLIIAFVLYWSNFVNEIG